MARLILPCKSSCLARTSLLGAYQGSVWKIRVELPDAYPYKSPSIGFVNKIYHPNVDEMCGSVCLDVINQTWSPMFDLVNVFEVFLPQLLLYPNPPDPLNGEAAALMMRDRTAYEQRVKVKRYPQLLGSLLKNPCSFLWLLVYWTQVERTCLYPLYHDGTQSVASNDHPVFSTVLRVTKKEEEFVFSDIFEQPIPSLLRGYSAPIRLESDLSDSDLFFLLAHDSNEFNRWEAGQLLARKLMLSLVTDFQQNKPLALNPKFVQGLRSILCDTSLDKEFIAKAVTLPGEGEIMDKLEVADPDAVHAVRTFIRSELASQLKSEFLSTVQNNRSSEEYVVNHLNMAHRALKNIALAYLASLEDPEITELALHEYNSATNMTEQFAALTAIAQKPGKTRDDVLVDFYSKWQHDFLVVNKWFALQAMSDIPGNVENVCNLLNHPAFDLRNPNKVHSLIGGFCGSPVNFHAKDGSGYKFLGEIVLQLDKLNPQVASRMVSAFSSWRRFDESRQKLAKEQLEKIMSDNGLSENDSRLPQRA